MVHYSRYKQLTQFQKHFILYTCHKYDAGKHLLQKVSQAWRQQNRTEFRLNYIFKTLASSIAD